MKKSMKLSIFPASSSPIPYKKSIQSKQRAATQFVILKEKYWAVELQRTVKLQWVWKRMMKGQWHKWTPEKVDEFIIRKNIQCQILVGFACF